MNLDDPETLEKIIVEAIDDGKLELRGKWGEELVYAPDQQAPYSGWAKWMHDNGQIEVLIPSRSGVNVCLFLPVPAGMNFHQAKGQW